MWRCSTNAVTGDLTLSGISDFELGTAGASHVAPGTSDRTDVSGTLTLGGTLNLIDNAGANGQGSAGAGSYLIFTYANTLSGSFTGITNITGYHAKVVDGGAGTGSGQGVFLDNYQVAAANAIATPVTLTNVHVGGAFGTSALTITNTSSAVLSEGLDATQGAVTGDASVGGTNIVNLAGGTSSTDISVGLGAANTAIAGAKTGTVTIDLASNGANSGYANTPLTSQVITVNGGVYDYAAANTITTPVNMGNVHVGGTPSSALTITNTAPVSAYTEGLNATKGAVTGDASVGGTNIVNLAGGSSSSTILVGLTTATVGAKSGTVTIDLASNGTNSGLADTALTSQVITVNGSVYSGLSTWIGASGGSWGTIAGTGGGAFGLNWGVDQGSPGLDPGFTGVDTATFGSTSGSVTVNLDGAAPSLNAVTFNGTGSYTIAQGAGATSLALAGTAPAITATGTQVISAPVVIVAGTGVAVTNAPDSLTMSGAISGGGGSLTKSGAGTLTLSGTNSFSGQLSVQNGTLAIGTINNASATGPLGSSALSVSLGNTGAQTGTLRYTGADATPSSSKKFTLATGGTGVFQVDTGATNLTLSGVIDGSGAMTKTGAGILTLSGVNTFTGQLSVQNGTLSIATINNVSANGTLGNSNALLPVILGASGQTGTLKYTAATGSSTKTFTLASGGTGGFEVTTALTLSGMIDGGGGLTKLGAGTLNLTSNANQFTGPTLISAGKVTLGTAAAPTAYALWKSPYDTTGSNGTTIGLSYLGTVPVAAPWLGGLAGGVNLASAVTAGYSNFTSLTLNPQTGTSVSYSGVIANGSGNIALNKTGPGTQTLTGTNIYGGATTVWAGTLALSGASGTSLLSAFTVRGGTLSLDNSTTWTDRVSDTAALSLGSLTLTSSNDAGIQSETVGATTFAVGGKVTINNGATAGDQTTLSLGAVTRSAGAAIDFVGTGGTLGGDASSPNVTSTGTFPGTVNGILPWATVGGTQWAEDNFGSIRAYSGAFVALASAIATDNARETAGSTLGAAAAANSLNIASSGSGTQTLALGANNLTLGDAAATAGAILKSGSDAWVISGTGQVRAGSAGAGTELIAHVDGGVLTISAPLNTAILGIAKGGTGDLILSGARVANMTGATSIAGGQLEFQGAGFTLSGVVTGAGGLTVNLNAGQTLIMGNNANSYAGPTIVKGGYLASPGYDKQGLPGGLGRTPSTNTSLIGSNLILEGGIFYASYVFDKDLGAGPHQVQILAGTSGFVNTAGSGGAASFKLDSGRELVWGSTYFNPTVFVHSTVGDLTLNLANGIDLTGSTRTILVGDATYNANAGGGVSQLGGVIRTSSLTAGLTKTGIGTLLLSGASTFNGAVTVSQGTLAFSGNANVASANPLGQSSADAANLLLANGTTLKYTGAVASTDRNFTINGTADGDSASLNASGTAAVSFTNTASPAYGTAGQTRTLILTGTSTFANTLAANIADNGGAAVSLTKTGAGLWVLSGANIYSGATTVSAGTLQIAKQASLYNGNTANWTAAKINVKNAATLALNVDSAGAAGFTSANLSTLLSNISVANTAAEGLHGGAKLVFDTTLATGATFTQGNAIANSTGAFGGAISVTKLGTGILVLDKANTYAGPTIISAGTLQLGSGTDTGSLSTSSVITVGTGATFAVNQTDSVTQGTHFSALIGGAGSVANVGSGTLVLNAPTYYTGTTKATTGTIQLSHNLAIQNSALDTTGAGKVAFTVTTPVIGGLSGASGDLSSVFDATSYATVTALTLNPQSGITFTYGGVIANGAPAGMALTKTGAGTQVLQGASTYSGATNINAGTLTVSGASGALASTTINLNGGGLTLDNATNSGTRVSDSATINVNGSSPLTFSHAGAAATDYSETIDTLSLQSGFLTYTGSQANATGPRTSNVLFNTLSRSGASNTSTVNFAGTGLGTNARNTIKFGAGVTAGSDLGPWAVVNGADFATYDATLGVKAAANTTLAADSSGASTNWKMTVVGVTINADLNPSFKTLLVSDTTVRTLAINANTVSVGGISSTGKEHVISGAGAVQALTEGDALYVNVGTNSLTISSVIQNVGAGPTPSALVKSGTGALTLGGTNTYTGGTVISGGSLTVSADNNFGAADGGITFSGTPTVNFFTGTIGSGRTITLTEGANPTFDNLGGVTIAGPVTGSGGFTGYKTSQGNPDLTLSSTANTFTGPINLRDKGASGTGAYTFNSLKDAPGAGNIKFSYTGTGADFIWGSGAIAPLVLTYRQLDLAGTRGPVIKNNNATDANTITINTDLLVSAAGNKTLTLGGTNTGANTFAGKIVDGTSVVAVINLTKTGAGTWVLSGNNTFTGGATINAGTLQLGSAGALNSIAGLENAVAFGSGSTGTLVLAGNSVTIANLQTHATLGAPIVQNANAANATLTVGNPASASGTFAGVIQDGTGGGTLALIKAGAGALTLSGANTYTGGTTLTAGTLNINSAGVAGVSGPLGNSAVANTGNTFTINGGAIDNTSASAKVVLNVNPITVGGDFAFSTAAGTANNNLTLPGDVNLGASTRTITTNGAGVLTLSGIISNESAGLTKAGTGTLTLTGANTYTGATTVSGGRLQLDGNSAAGTLTTSGLAVGAGGTLGFTAGTASTLDLTGKPFSLGGTVVFDIGADDSDAMTVGDFNLTATSVFTFNAIGGGFTNGATYTLLTSANPFTIGGGCTITGLVAGRLTLAPKINEEEKTVTITPLLYEGIWNKTVGGNWSDGNSGATGGNWTNYKPTVTGDAALFGSAITGSAVITVDTPHSVGYMRFDNTNAVTIGAGGGSSNLTIDNGASTASVVVNSGLHIIAENVLLASNVSVAPASGTTLTVSGNLSGARGVSLTDAGTLVLSGSANNYTGATSISAGTLSLTGSLTGGTAITTSGTGIVNQGAAGVISGASSFTQGSAALTSILDGNNTYTGPTAITAGTLEIGGAGRLGGGTYANTIAIAGGATFRYNSSSPFTVSGRISGSGSLTKDGLGTLTLSRSTGYNTFSGGTIVNEGTLKVDCIDLVSYNPQGALGSGDVTVNNGGTIEVGFHNSFVGYETSPSQTITINSGGLITNLTTTTPTTHHLSKLVMSGGTLNATTPEPNYGSWLFDQGVSTPGNGSSSLISGGNATLTQDGGTVFNIGEGDTLTISTVLDYANQSGGDIPDTGLIKSGLGLLILSAANTYEAATTVEAGTLQIAGAGSLGAAGSYAGNITNNGTFLYSSSAAQTLSGVISGSGPIVVNAGRLQLNGSAAAGTLTTSSLTVGTGGTLGFTAGTASTLNLDANAFSLGGTVALDIGASGVNDALTVGNFTLDGNSALTFNIIGAIANGATYTLLTSANDIVKGDFSITGPAGKFSLTPEINKNTVTLTCALDLGVWNQTGGGIWSNGNAGGPTGGNWDNYKPTVAGDAALFGSAITAPAVIAVDTPHRVGYMRFDDANAYTIGAAGSSNLTLDNGASSALVVVTSGSHIIAENVALASSVAVAPASGATLTVSGSLTGAGGVLVGDAGSLVLSGVNTYTGATTITSGTLEIGGAGQLGGGTYAGPITINTGATFKYNSDANQTLSLGGTGGTLRGSGSFIKDGTGTLTLSEDSGAEPSSNLFTGPITINQGVLRMVGDYAFYNNACTYTIASGAVLHLDGSTYIPVGTTTINGAGTLLITGDDFYSYEAGDYLTLSLGSGGLIDVKAGGGGLWNGYATDESITWTANRAKLNVDGLFDLWNGKDVFVDALTGAGTVQRTKSGRVVTLTVGVDNGSGTFSGIITNGAYTAVAFTKTGSGTQTLTGANAYTGATTVNAGTLAVSGEGAINSTSGITVNGPTAAFMQNSSVASTRTFTLTQGTLGGTGTINTAITVGPNVTLAPGDRTLVSPEAGVLTIANTVNLAGATTGGATEMRLFSATESDMLEQKTAGTFTYGGILEVTAVGSLAFAIGNNWDLFDFGSASGTFSNDSDFGTVGGGSTYLPLLTIGKKWSFNYTTGVLSVALGLIPGDADKNGVVDAADYITVKQNFGMTTGATWEMGNFDSDIDGNVDWDDLQTLMANFGTRSVGGAPATPEPATLGLLAIGALAVLRRRRRA